MLNRVALGWSRMLHLRFKSCYIYVSRLLRLALIFVTIRVVLRLALIFVTIRMVVTFRVDFCYN